MTATTIAGALTGLNLILLATLAWTWLNNYLEIRTPMVLGLVLFAVTLGIENGVALYFIFVDMGAFYAMDSTVQNFVAAFRALQFMALCFLTWATLQ